MAKLLPYYSLCPLIEQKNFIGLTNDIEPDHLVVTVNSNIVSRYIISSPKQVTSWNTKGFITSPVIYDKTEKQYVGIFNDNEIRFWTLSTDNIDKVKKYKFANRIHTILNVPESNRLLIVFKNGYVTDLHNAIPNRKVVNNSDICADQECVYHSEVISFHDLSLIALLTRKCGETCKLHLILLNNLVFKPVSIELNRKDSDAKILCHCIVADRYCSFLSLWSDNKLFSLQLFPSTEVSFPGNFLIELQMIDTSCSATLCTLSPNYICIYGSHSGSKESILLLFSVKYNLIHWWQLYKRFSSSPQLWNFGSNLFLIIGHNLVAIPYILENQKLSSLVGVVDSLKSEVNLLDSDENLIESDVLPESKIYSTLVPNLLKKENVSIILSILNKCADVPDNVICIILAWCLSDIHSRDQVLKIVLFNHSVSDSLELRRALSLETSFILLDEIIKYLELTDDKKVSLIKWASSILDLFYQQYLLANNTDIHDRLKKIKHILEKDLHRLNSYKELLSAVSCIGRKRLILKTKE